MDYRIFSTMKSMIFKIVFDGSWIGNEGISVIHFNYQHLIVMFMNYRTIKKIKKK